MAPPCPASRDSTGRPARVVRSFSNLPPRQDWRRGLLQFERRQLRKLACPGVDFAALERGEALHAKFFHCEASQHRTVNHGVAQRALVDLSRAGEIAHEAPGEAVTCPRGVVDFV